MKTATKAVKKPAAKKVAPKANKIFTAEEREAMEAAVADRKRGKISPEQGEADCRAAIEKMTGSDRKMAERIHAIIKEVAPALESKTWYGMPAYAKAGQTICFFQNASKFKARYATFGFTDKAMLDEGSMWPNAYALTAITPADEAKIKALLKRAVG
jgi:hypothetical protein